MDLPTRLDLFALGRDYVTSRAKRIDPAQVDVEGSDVNIFVGSSSVMGRYVVDHLGYAVSQLFLDSCFEENLDRWAFDRYQMLRKGAAPARGTVRFYRQSTAAGAGSIPIGTRLRTLTGADYVTTSVATFAASTLESRAYVRANEAGKGPQAGANAIQQIVSRDSLWDRTLSVINDDDTAGGEDAESDDNFKDRIRAFWRAARRGVRGAIEFGATEVAGVTSASAIEVLETQQLQLGLVNAPYVLPARLMLLYIADSSGVASEALANDVRAALEEYRAGGIAVIIATSLPQVVDVRLRLSFRANVDTVLLSDAVRAAVVEFINSLPVNSPLYVSDIASVLSRFRADGVLGNEESIIAPVGDVYPDAGRTLRTTPTQVVVE